MKRKILAFSAMVVTLGIILAGCHSNTMEGLGSDVQKVGQKIEG